MGTDEEYSSSGKVKRSKGIKPWLPVIGMLLLLSFGAMAYVLSEPLYNAVASSVAMDITPDVGRLVAGVVLFVVLSFVGLIIYTIFAPKRTHLTNENLLERERKAKKAEQVAKKKRQRQVAIEMRRQREAAEAQRKGGKPK
jgi:hypothetical protein